MLQIHSVEITNICNLRCNHCPSLGSKYPRGMISLCTFEKAVTYASNGSLLVISGFGESLLHPQIEDIFSIAKAHNVKIDMPTNGILMKRDVLKHLLNNNLTQLEISIHTEKSLGAYKMAYEMIADGYPNVRLIGNVMKCYETKLEKWASNQGVTAEQMSLLRIINMHNWAMNDRAYSEDENKKWQSKCEFLKHNICVIRWDGKVNTCCVDDSGTNYVGHIDDFENLAHKPEQYKLCHKCSPAWFTGEELGVMFQTK